METLITVSRAARAANLTPAALYSAIRLGKLTATEKYGLLLVTQTDVEKYLAHRAVGRPRQNGNSKGEV
jgi:hypothetical protein